jgi:glycolate oxidase FAD binding subunit
VTTLRPSSIEDVAAAVRDSARVVPHGALTKRPLVGNDAGAVCLDMTALTGITACDPAEFTFTARAGTPLREIAALLAAHGQHMPFDPPLVDSGATIGGTLAAGLNGPGRLRYGGLRDFIIGVRFVDGTARVVSGGGRVVKNAAGFDLPKLMVGSMGRLGVLVELTFKVFPAPRGRRTIRVACDDLPDAITCMTALGRLPLELEALELAPPDTIMIRIGGDEAAVDSHAARVGDATGRAFEVYPEDEYTGGLHVDDVSADTVSADDVSAAEAEPSFWRSQREFGWIEEGQCLIRVPLTLREVIRLDCALERLGVPRRYGVAGNVAWLGWPVDRPIADLDLAGLGLADLGGMVIRGSWPADRSPRIGASRAAEAPFARAVKHALDPQERLPMLV